MNTEACDLNIKQDLPTSCAIRCQQIILRDYGIEVEEKDLREIAVHNGWYDESVGVYMRDNGKLLGCFGIEYHHSQYNNLLQIEKELAHGHRVMVNLNKAKLFGEIEKEGHHEACHAVVITQISKANGWLLVMDPAKGDARQKHSIPTFVGAWRDSNNYMLATSKPALYRYDADSMIMMKEE